MYNTYIHIYIIYIYMSLSCMIHAYMDNMYTHPFYIHIAKSHGYWPVDLLWHPHVRLLASLAGSTESYPTTGKPEETWGLRVGDKAQHGGFHGLGDFQLFFSWWTWTEWFGQAFCNFWPTPQRSDGFIWAFLKDLKYGYPKPLTITNNLDDCAPRCRKPPYASRTCVSHRGHRQEKELDLRTARAEAWSNMSQSALIGPHYVRNYHIMNHIISWIISYHESYHIMNHIISWIISYQIKSYHMKSYHIIHSTTLRYWHDMTLHYIILHCITLHHTHTHTHIYNYIHILVYYIIYIHNWESPLTNHFVMFLTKHWVTAKTPRSNQSLNHPTFISLRVIQHFFFS